jgi:hypothetical protein
MVKVIGRPGNVEDEHPEAALEIDAQLVGNAVVASYQVRAKGLVVLKWP